MGRLDKVSAICIAFLVVKLLLGAIQVDAGPHIPSWFNRSSFPDEFIFGAGSAAYQSEGAANEGGRMPSIWDTYSTLHRTEEIVDDSTGVVADDFYHRYKEDIQRLKGLGMQAFRLSISWSRVLPYGKISRGVNQEGIDFYNKVFDEIVANGLKPFVTLFHWDLPQALEDEYLGFLSTNIVNDYRDYVDLCFREFGDRVKHWTTLNEPLSYTMFGYVTGTNAPGRCSNYVGNCTAGNSATEPYIAGHNLLLAHAAGVQLYRDKYQVSQKGKIGITMASQWYEPKTRSKDDLQASFRVLDFFLGWFLHPITYGDYPASMRFYVGNRLPKFTAEQSNLLKGSIDFLGLNYYTTNYVSAALSATKVNISYLSDLHAVTSSEKNGKPICTPTALSWLFICPAGIRKLILYVKEKYNDPIIYITENGMADANNNTLPLSEALKDNTRISYFRGHLWYLQQVIREGAKVKGHFAWSFLDDFEWNSGYSVRFGLTFVDFKNGLKRYSKDSSLWYKKFLEG